jgi:general secretion pathway protein B
LAELPPELRSQLPPLAISGSVWSENAASRFVIVNGQVVREGEAAAPGVTLERIGPKAALMRWREQRFEVGF